MKKTIKSVMAMALALVLTASSLGGTALAASSESGSIDGCSWSARVTNTYDIMRFVILTYSCMQYLCDNLPGSNTRRACAGTICCISRHYYPIINPRIIWSIGNNKAEMQAVF